MGFIPELPWVFQVYLLTHLLKSRNKKTHLTVGLYIILDKCYYILAHSFRESLFIFT